MKIRSPRLTILASLVLSVVLAASSPGKIASAATPPLSPTDPCYTTALRTVRQTTRIYYAPEQKATTAFSLPRGGRFFVCTNTNMVGYSMFILTNGLPKLYVPVGTFG